MQNPLLQTIRVLTSTFKTHNRNPPLLSRLEDGEPLYLYLAMSHSAVSLVWLREDRGTQRPVYFTSKALQGAEE
jgi:hypothetical protein